MKAIQLTWRENHNICKMDLYKLLINHLGVKLKSLGFTKNRTTFYTKKENNWGLINFQKSRSNEPGETKFTINIGVCSEKVRSFLEEKTTSKPEIEGCHWQNRVGFLLPQKKDYWWKIYSDTDIEALENEIENVIVTYCIPEIDNYISDESLERSWSNGISPGVGELQRYIYLTTLLKSYERPNLTTVAKALKDFAYEKPFETTAENHLRKLKVRL
jgi:hypothetical protein